MTLRAWKLPNRTAQKTLSFLEELLHDYHPRNFALELWDGSGWAPEAGQFRRFTWRINDPGGLRSAIGSASQVALAEAYVYGDFDIEGDIEAVFPLADYLLNKEWSKKEKLRLGGFLFGLPSARRDLRPAAKLRAPIHSRERDRQAVSYHYDVSNDFYALWLDENLVYSSAYFIRPDDDLNTAQKQKLDYICRKLRLKPGERLLDMGCGWGGLIIHAARQYGVYAVGVTLSQNQLQLARERIQQAGLSDCCQVELLDYRDLNQPAAYDKLVSVGMVEHVGEPRLAEYFSHAYRLLRPGGVFLNHGIGRPQSRHVQSQPTFTDTYVFPDNGLVPIATMLRNAEDAGFEVRDVENLREHYALTLQHWLHGLEASAEQARRFADEIRYRVWRMYIAGSAYYFQTGRLGLYQTLLVKNANGRSELPLTRGDWYSTR